MRDAPKNHGNRVELHQSAQRGDDDRRRSAEPHFPRDCGVVRDNEGLHVDVDSLPHDVLVEAVERRVEQANPSLHHRTPRLSQSNRSSGAISATRGYPENSPGRCYV